jgi:DNA-binding XRE family transcriptional regulator
MVAVLEKVQTFTTPSGEEMVVMSRAEFDRLAALAADAEEDEADAAIFAERMAELEAGEADVLPADVSMHVRHGHSLLKAIRFWRNVRQVDLAKRAGVSQGFISDVENRRKGADPETMARIAAVLDVPVKWLV